jgi:putative ATP-binding cassette transporter
VLGASIGRVRRERSRGLLIYVGAASWGSFLFFVVIGSVVFGLSSWLDLSAAVRAGYTLMLLYMMHPMELLMESLPELSRAKIALEHIRDIGVGAKSLEPEPIPQAPAAFRGLRLSAVTHTYRREADDGVFAVGPLDLELSPGEVVFVIGGNGSGKTTLAKLLVGLYAPEAGQIELNDALVGAETREGYRQSFSAVFSDFHLFDKLLGIASGGLDERALQLLRSLELERHVVVKDGAFSTTQLSLGQRKRLALLVARLEDRSVYVFDEWAADQDPAYKDVFYRELLPELRASGKAVLVITHDDHYFGLADRCLRLENGRLSTWRAAVGGVPARRLVALHQDALERG